MTPPPGQASVSDWLVVRENGKRFVELVDGTLVEKPLGWLESLLGAVLIQWLGNYVAGKNLGVVTGADGFTELYSDTVRGPDVAFVSWDRLPGGKLPTSALPSLVPNFVIEILSKGNTYGEMSRKRREYFHPGVELMWMVDHRNRTITVYRTSQRFEVIRDGEMIDGAPVLPDWKFNTADFFAVLDQQPPAAT
jgi:Uma2 family endonuclease